MQATRWYESKSIETEVTVIYRHLAAGQNHNIQVAYKSLKIWQSWSTGNYSNKSKLHPGMN